MKTLSINSDSFSADGPPAPRGTNQRRMRHYNERLILSLVRAHERMSRAQIAKLTGLSAQSVSNIANRLEAEQLLLRCSPEKGRVGQPSIPFRLNPDGVFALGLFVGRRSAEFVLIDFVGKVRQSTRITFPYPTPKGVLDFTLDSISKLTALLPASMQDRIVSIGIAAPFQIWHWSEQIGAPSAIMDEWRAFDIEREIRSRISLPVYHRNDITSACAAELMYGRGSEFQDYLYIYVGLFVGGGIVLNGSLFPGRSGNAGALASMPVPAQNGKADRLVDYASIYTLEVAIRSAGGDSSVLWTSPDDWSAVGNSGLVDNWISDTARSLAFAVAASAAVIDFQAAIIDGGVPLAVRAALRQKVSEELAKLDLAGMAVPEVTEGSIGPAARAIGAASLSYLEHFMIGGDAQMLTGP